MLLLTMMMAISIPCLLFKFNYYVGVSAGVLNEQTLHSQHNPLSTVILYFQGEGLMLMVGGLIGAMMQ